MQITRKCFGTNELNILSRICKTCLDFEECKSFEPKKIRVRRKQTNGANRYISI